MLCAFAFDSIIPKSDILTFMCGLLDVFWQNCGVVSKNSGLTFVLRLHFCVLA